MEAAIGYREYLSGRHTELRENLLENARAQGAAMTPEQLEHEVDRAMAPFTIDMELLVSTVAQGGIAPVT